MLGERDVGKEEEREGEREIKIRGEREEGARGRKREGIEYEEGIERAREERGRERWQRERFFFSYCMYPLILSFETIN
jgi:hypothetical protein